MNYKVSGTDLTTVANAIRTKGGTSAGLSFPDGFASAISAIPTGSSPTLITKSISANGTYSASDDDADGYSSVTVSVPSKCITGTFTAESSEAGNGKSITVPYSGSGYPIAIMIYPTTGTYKDGSSIYSLAQKSVIVAYAAIKVDIADAPSYLSADSSLEKNKVTALVRYKNSDSDSTAMSASAGESAIFTSYGASTSPTATVRMSNATTMSVMIASSSYGFKHGIEYTYQIIYSS